MSSVDVLIDRAKSLLNSGEVAMVVGYEQGSTADRRRVSFARSAGQVDQFVVDGLCEDNLAGYLRRGQCADAMAKSKVAIFLSLSGVRTVNLLASEAQIDADRVIVLGFDLDRPGKIDSDVKVFDGESVSDYAQMISEIKSKGFYGNSDERASLIAEIDAMSDDERLAYWREQFSRCVKCYACRQVCPMCYCERCVVDANQPQWLNSSAHELGNMEWNLVRGFHLAGRCIGCGNCERACPAGIKLMLINQKLEQEVLKEFDYFAGEKIDQSPLLADFRKDDPDDFIL